MRGRIVSRECKIMLRPSRFAGTEEQLFAAADALWGDVAKKVRRVVLRSTGDLRNMNEPRLIRFLDTATKAIFTDGYILRERRRRGSSQREVTLKFRHPDRYVYGPSVPVS